MAEAAVADLQEAILAGDLAPGAPLRLEELARSLGMSISPVREAVRQLESLGLAVHVPHRGARVSELAIEDLRDTYEVRLALETLAVRRAAERFEEADGATSAEHLEHWTEAHKRGDSVEARREHAASLQPVRASGSDWLVRLIRPSGEQRALRALSLPKRGTPRRRRQEHEAILDACVRNDPDEAEEQLRLHLALTANLVAGRMGAEDLF